MKKKILTGVLVVIACGVLSGGAYYGWLITPPSMPQTADDAAALITSRRFQRLSDDRKLAYVSHIRDLMEKLDADQRRRLRERYGDDPQVRAAMRRLGEQFVVDMARRYAQAPPLQKQIVLDTIIGAMEQRRARAQSRPDEPLTDQQQAKREQRRAEVVDELADRAAQGNPQHGAYLGGMLKGLQQRRRELGLPEWRPPDR